MTDWSLVRGLFPIDSSKVYLDHMLLASHPKPVAHEVARLRRLFDKRPGQHWIENVVEYDERLHDSCADFIGGKPGEVAFVDSATMGLGIVIGGFRFRSGDEVIVCDQGHYSAHTAVDYVVKRLGVIKKKISIYDQPCDVTEAEILRNILGAISSKTRMIVMTWVHSSTGVKIPVKAISDTIRALNKERPDHRQIRLLVDGVHGFGVEDFTVPELGCDFFITSCHKWLFGPRGTGFVWFHPRTEPEVEPIIPNYDIDNFQAWVRREVYEPTMGQKLTPGGFCSFEHRWALPKAFSFHSELGRQAIQDRAFYLASLLKEGLRETPGVKLVTPVDQNQSCSLVCFEIEGIATEDVISRLGEMGVYGTATPYYHSFPRFSPAFFNTDDECYQAVGCIASIARDR